MLYRAVAVFVVLFWLTMTALLVRHEIRPGDSALREVPLEHVVKLLFHHQQPSDLNIVSDKVRLGHLHIQPRSEKASDLRVITFRGNLHLPVPGGGKRQRVAWEGELEMDKALVVQRFRLAQAEGDGQDLRAQIVVLPRENVARYEIRSGTTTERQEFTLDERGARDVMQQLGLDPALWPTAPRVQAAAPIVKAQRSSLKVHGERIDTYLVTLQSNGQTWVEGHVDQLGHILQATTLLGYTFAPDDLLP